MTVFISLTIIIILLCVCVYKIKLKKIEDKHVSDRTPHSSQSKIKTQSITTSTPVLTSFLASVFDLLINVFYLRTLLLPTLLLIHSLTLSSWEISRYSEMMCQVFIIHMCVNEGEGKITSQPFPHLLIVRSFYCENSIQNLLGKVKSGS